MVSYELAGSSYDILILEEKAGERSIFRFNSQALVNLLSQSSSFLYVIAIAGSQSTGKSTLLNRAFGFAFRTMDSYNTCQTTHGIDIGISPSLKLLCLDMEASDSSGERNEEDNSFIQRAISAFGIAVSNLLLYNVFVRDIRTVRELNSLAR
jgi:hypothetical protein